MLAIMGIYYNLEGIINVANDNKFNKSSTAIFKV